MKHAPINKVWSFVPILFFFSLPSWAQGINDEIINEVIASALEQTTQTLYYDPSYRKLDYPGGDVPLDRGVCTDVLIRAFRAAGVDLQVLVHEDMTRAFHAYPNLWGLKRPDPNIDHRRVPNLMTYFERAGKAFALTGTRQNIFPGDIVAWRLPDGRPHIGIVSNLRVPEKDRYLVVHNIGFGTKLEDILYQYEIIGHYRFFALTDSARMAVWFQKAVQSYGKDYLDAEYHLRHGGAAAIDTLQQNRDHPDPVARLMVECLLAWMQGKAPEYQKALDYLDIIPEKAAKTPRLYPNPYGVANNLKQYFGSRVADFLALRLAKEVTWPLWRVGCILLYLQEQKLPSTTSAVIRFAAETENEEMKRFAIETINAIRDPELKLKLEIEQKRLEQIHKKLPKDLANTLSDS